MTLGPGPVNVHWRVGAPVSVEGGMGGQCNQCYVSQHIRASKQKKTTTKSSQKKSNKKHKQKQCDKEHATNQEQTAPCTDTHSGWLLSALPPCLLLSLTYGLVKCTENHKVTSSTNNHPGTTVPTGSQCNTPLTQSNHLVRHRHVLSHLTPIRYHIWSLL